MTGITEENKLLHHMEIIPFRRRTKLEQEIFLREIHVRKAKLKSATDLSVLFALFSVLGGVELKIDEDAEPLLVLAYASTSALLVTNTVLTKIGLLWMIPQLDTALFLGMKNSDEIDRVPPLFFLWDVIWLCASIGGFALFTAQIIFISWVKYPNPSMAAAPTAIILPVFLILLGCFIYFARTLGKPVIDIEKFRRDYDHLQGV